MGERNHNNPTENAVTQGCRSCTITISSSAITKTQKEADRYCWNLERNSDTAILRWPCRMGVGNAWSDLTLLPVISCRGPPLGRSHVEANGQGNTLMVAPAEWRRVQSGSGGADRRHVPGTESKVTVWSKPDVRMWWPSPLRKNEKLCMSITHRNIRWGMRHPSLLRLALAVKGLYLSLGKVIFYQQA